jgi:hypothetical protein
MEKSRSPRLRLARETLRRLDARALAEVRGGLDADGVAARLVRRTEEVCPVADPTAAPSDLARP